MQGVIRMSKKELNQIEIFEKLKRREIRQKRAASILGLSVRQVKRKLRRYRLQGPDSLIHKARGKNSNNQITQKKLDQAIKIVKNHYWDFGPTLAHEKLIKEHKCQLSLSTLRKEMIRTGLWQPKTRRKPHVHQLRERRACYGELVQLDGSPHAWFEDRGKKCNLNVSIDDATGRSLSLFSQTETTQDYFRLVEKYIYKLGLPRAFYVDRHSIFKVNNPSSTIYTKPSKFNQDHEGLTQFARAMRELDIELIFASTPQAKGRVERVNKTYQNRLVKEMRLQGLSNIKQANKYLPIFEKEFNQQFSVQPKSGVDMHRKLNKNIDLSDILCLKNNRILSKNLTCQYNNSIFQIKTKRSAFTLRKTSITICERYDGQIQVFDHRHKPLEFEVIKKLTNQTTVNSKQLNHQVDDILIKQAKRDFRKHNPWESSFKELSEDIAYYKPAGTI